MTGAPGTLSLAARIVWIYIKIAAVLVMIGSGAPKFIYGGF
jgi:hypothetical protein